MKIIYLHQYFKFPDERGGTRSYDLSISFRKRGYEVIVISSSKNPKYKLKRWNVVRRDGVEVHFIYSPYGTQLSYLKRTFVFIRFMWFSTLKLLTMKGDIVLATSTPLTIGIPAMIKKWIHRTPYIFEVRDVWPEAVIAIGAVKNRWIQKWLYFLEKLIYKNANIIVPLSTDMKDSIISRFPQFKNKVDLVIENIAEINRFQNNFRSIKLEEIIGFRPRFSVLYAGTFGRVNGLNYAVNLAKKTLKLDPSIIYLLVGTGGETDKIKTLAQEKGVLNKNLFILPPVSKDELPAWYNSVQMGSSFVIDVKELWANSANKFFDSLAAGKPVLINHLGWQANVISNDNVGYVLPKTLNDSEVNSFVNYTNDSELHVKQREKALEKAISSYSLEKATDKYLTVFNLV